MTAVTETQTETAPPIGYGIGVRHLITFMIFFGITVCYSMRSDLSIAIVAMLDNKDNPDFEEFDWDAYKDTVLSSFFWGYIVLQVPSGLIAQRFGANRIMLAGVAISSLMTLLTPIVTHSGGWGALCAIRVIMGLSQGSLFPSMHSLLSKWAPPEERGRLSTLAFAGAQVGTIIAFSVSGILAKGSGGWPSIFYVFGGLGCLWCVLWFFVGGSNPSEHRFISKAERDYIVTAFAEGEASHTLQTPWMALLKSGPFWAIILAHCAQNWGFWILMTEIPSFMDTVLGFEIKSNGLFSALPYVVMAILSLVFGFISDLMYRKSFVTLVLSRKMFNTVGFLFPAVALAYLGYIDKKEQTLGVVLLTIAVGLNAGVYCGFQVNHIDLSPNFAGTMMGITNGFSNILSIIGPLVVGAVVTEKGSTEQWRIIFWISAVIYLLGVVLFMYLAKAERQPWDDPDYSKKSKESEANNSC